MLQRRMDDFAYFGFKQRWITADIIFDLDSVLDRLEQQVTISQFARYPEEEVVCLTFRNLTRNGLLGKFGLSFTFL